MLMAAVAAAALPAASAAQRPAPDARRRVEGHELRAMDLVFNRRARLGVKVNLQAQDTDSIGAYIDAVTPGGPADQAGIRAGDIITKLDGKPLVTGKAADADDDRRSLPGLRLIELAAKLEPNDTIPVEFHRGNETKTVSLVTGDEPNWFGFRMPGARAFAWEMRPGERMEMEPFGMDPLDPMRMDLPRFEFFMTPLADLELAPLNPDLGQYFGTTEGVLVLSVPKSSPLGLKGGDVVLAIDGRKANTPSQVLRILRSYDRGESFKLDILRNRKRETITGKLPQQEREKVKVRERTPGGAVTEPRPRCL
jgi:S1-C subfamily serine protease